MSVKNTHCYMFTNSGEASAEFVRVLKALVYSVVVVSITCWYTKLVCRLWFQIVTLLQIIWLSIDLYSEMMLISTLRKQMWWLNVVLCTTGLGCSFELCMLWEVHKVVLLCGGVGRGNEHTWWGTLTPVLASILSNFRYILEILTVLRFNWSSQWLNKVVLSSIILLSLALVWWFTSFKLIQSNFFIRARQLTSSILCFGVQKIICRLEVAASSPPVVMTGGASPTRTAEDSRYYFFCIIACS